MIVIMIGEFSEFMDVIKKNVRSTFAVWHHFVTII